MWIVFEKMSQVLKTNDKFINKNKIMKNKNELKSKMNLSMVMIQHYKVVTSSSRETLPYTNISNSEDHLYISTYYIVALK